MCSVNPPFRLVFAIQPGDLLVNNSLSSSQDRYAWGWRGGFSRGRPPPYRPQEMGGGRYGSPQLTPPPPPMRPMGRVGRISVGTYLDSHWAVGVEPWGWGRLGTGKRVACVPRANGGARGRSKLAWASWCCCGLTGASRHSPGGLMSLWWVCQRDTSKLGCHSLLSFPHSSVVDIQEKR